MSLFDYLDSNQGVVLSISVLVYILASIVLVYFTRKSVHETTIKARREAVSKLYYLTELMALHFDTQYLAKVQAQHLLCLLGYVKEGKEQSVVDLEQNYYDLEHKLSDLDIMLVEVYAGIKQILFDLGRLYKKDLGNLSLKIFDYLQTNKHASEVRSLKECVTVEALDGKREKLMDAGRKQNMGKIKKIIDELFQALKDKGISVDGAKGK